MIGNPGQANYSAANAFTDALASCMRKATGTGQSICWGALQLGVLEQDAETRKKLARYGMDSLSRAETMKLLEWCLIYNPSLVMCTKINWATIAKSVPINSTMEFQMAKILQRKAYFIKRMSFENEMMKTSKDANTIIYKVIKTVMMLDDDELVPDATLQDLGVDSQQVSAIHSALLRTFEKLSVTTFDIVTMTVREISEKIMHDADILETESTTAESEIHELAMPDDNRIESREINQPTEVTIAF
jgi:hypothetical protein